MDRRAFLAQAGLATAGMLGLSQRPGRAADPHTAAGHQAGPDPALKVCRPADPLQALLDGNARFVKAWAAADAAPTPAARARVLSALWEKNCYTPASVLKGGQAPWAAVLACADSRVAPEWVFDAALSDLFVIRSAGNTAFDDAIASLEYAISHLGTQLVLVMGHSSCGAVKAARGSDPLTPLLTVLVKPIRASFVAGEDLASTIKGNARYAAAQITKRSDVMAQAVASGKVAIRSSYFDIATGKVSVL
ncbi:MAG: carbonic anhydrase [Cyanobacteriota bacterium]